MRKIRRKNETGVHHRSAKNTGKKANRKNLQGVGVGVKTPQKTQNLLRVFNLLPKLLPKLLPLRIFGVRSCVYFRALKIRRFKAIMARVWYNIGRASIEGARRAYLRRACTCTHINSRAHIYTRVHAYMSTHEARAHVSKHVPEPTRCAISV